MISLSKTCEHQSRAGTCGAPRVRIMGYADGRGGFFDLAECSTHNVIPREARFAPIVSVVTGEAHTCPVCRVTASPVRTLVWLDRWHTQSARANECRNCRSVRMT